MKIVLRMLLAILLLLVGAFSGLCVIIGMPDFTTAITKILSSSNASKTGYYFGSIIAMLFFLTITFFSIRTAIRIFIKSKKMKSEPQGSQEILDDLI